MKKQTSLKDLKVRKSDAKKVTGGLSSAISETVKNLGNAVQTATRGA